MTRDIHRAPSRLASSRPESSWKTHSTLPSEQNALPGRIGALRDPSDYDLEHDIADGVPGVSPLSTSDDAARIYDSLIIEETPEAPPARSAPPALDSQSIYEIEADEAPYRPMPAVKSRGGNGHSKAIWRGPHKPAAEPDYAPPALPPSAPPRVAVESELDAPRYDFTQQRGELTPSDQYQLLLYNIQLYDDNWKLLRIRAAKEEQWMRAYLIPRNSKMLWEEARQSGRLFQIAIDTFGNTIVREPEKPGLLQRLLNWLYGR